MGVKTVTVRLPQTTYERLCLFAESSEELPSETARKILREFLANLNLAELNELPENQPGYNGPIIGRTEEGLPIVRGRMVKPGEENIPPHIRIKMK